ncbi:MAG: tRNA pseudouridine(55) synthase TruB [Oligoflexales bacterium]
METRGLPVNGMLVIDKPEGMISKDVSRWLTKRIPKRTRLGHVGTLDPIASGVLPLLLGQATKLQDYLHLFRKAYEFDIKLGSETDTLDTDGTVIATADFTSVTEDMLRSAVGQFKGQIEQVPPMYSALKYNGKPLYEYAREGLQDQVPQDVLKRTVTIHDLEFLKFESGVATYRVVCSKGTYVRSLARSLAAAVGTIGTVSRIVRIETAGVSLDNAHSIAFIEDNWRDLGTYIVPLEQISLAILKWQCPNAVWVRRLKQGQRLVLDQSEFEKYISSAESRLINNDTVDQETGEMLLLDEEGAAFGIGCWKKHGVDLRKISLRRGLV